MPKFHDIEQNTEAWLALRLGKPTASCAEKLVTNTGSASKQLDGYAEQLAADLYAGKELDKWEGNQFTDHGHAMEEQAALWYSAQKDVELLPGGFFTDDLERYGASPDRLIAGCDDGCVEIKVLPKQHVKALMAWKKRGVPTDFISQNQMQMLAAGRSWVDRVYYNADLPKVIVRVHRDEKHVDLLNRQITVCIQKRDDILSILKEIPNDDF